MLNTWQNHDQNKNKSNKIHFKVLLNWKTIPNSKSLAQFKVVKLRVRLNIRFSGVIVD